MAISDITNRADASHLLRRAGFGGSATEIAALVGRSRRDCVNAVMGFRSTDPTPSGPDVGVPAFVTKVRQWDAHSEVISWWVQRMVVLANPTTVPSPVPAVAAPTPLQEKMTLFWHDHFACGQDKVRDIPAMWDQISMFRRLGLGDFGTLLRSVSVHPAMLVYLDNQSNVKGSEQENFARELMELHTIGVGEFTEDDVIAMARAWTGHNIVGWNGSEVDSTYVYRAADHDHGLKTLFGITANWNGLVRAAGEREVLSEFVSGIKQAATARFISGKVFRWFAHYEPSAAVAQSLADVFVSSSMSISALVRAVLEHDEFWGPESRWAQIKSPTELMVSVARRSGLPVADMGLRWNMESMGQVLLAPPNVAGWGSGADWLTTASAWGRGQMMRGLRWRASDAGLLSGTDQMTATDATQAIFDFFGLEEVSAATRSELERWHSEAHAAARWSIPTQGFMLGSMSPEFQVQ